MQAKEDGLVAAAVAALELRRLRGGLDAAADAVTALQRRKADLQGAVHEQQRTLQVCGACRPGSRAEVIEALFVMIRSWPSFSQPWK